MKVGQVVVATSVPAYRAGRLCSLAVAWLLLSKAQSAHTRLCEVGASGTPSDRPCESMNQGTPPEELAEVVDDVASVVGAEVTLLSRLPGGVNAGAMRVQLAGGANAVLKAEPRAHPNHLDETLRAQRIVEHMRRHGYPTPAWLGVGATATHIWHLMDFVDAAPAPELTQSLIEQLMEIIERQAGQASEPYDTGRTPGGSPPVTSRLSTGRISTRRPSSRVSASPWPGSQGIPPRCRPWSSACDSCVPTSHHHERYLTWSMPISQPPAMSWSATERWWRSWISGTQVAARGRLISPPSCGTPSAIRSWTESEGGCGRESSTWSAGRGRRCSQRHRSS